MPSKEQILFDMCIESNRVKSFKNWPFQSPSFCTKEKMAEAGFYFNGSRKEPDSACCFVCGKQLDGWEEGDDPWEEHKSHSSQCPFILLNKKENQISYSEMRELQKQTNIIRVTKLLDAEIERFKEVASEMKEELFLDLAKNSC